jgi:hypothetical protein
LPEKQEVARLLRRENTENRDEEGNPKKERIRIRIRIRRIRRRGENTLSPLLYLCVFSAVSASPR